MSTTSKGISIEVHFDPLDPDPKEEDDIKVIVSGPRFFRASSIALKLTADQAQDLAEKLIKAAEKSRSVPRAGGKGSIEDYF